MSARFLANLVVNDLWRELKIKGRRRFSCIPLFVCHFGTFVFFLIFVFFALLFLSRRNTDLILNIGPSVSLRDKQTIPERILKGIFGFYSYSPMESYVLDCLFCLLPSFLLFLFYVGLHCPRLCGWARVAVRELSWRLWVIICLILQLPLHKEKRTKAEDLKSLETDMVSGQVSDGPKLICKPTALARYLLQHCGSLKKAKLAAWPRGDPHVQTFSSQIFGEHREKVQFTRDHLLLKDGGIVALDWAIGTRLIELTAKRRWEVKKEHQSVRKTLGCFTSTPPVLLLIPQFWGGMTPHLQLLCSQAMRQGFYVVVFHHRGTAGSPLTTTRLTEFGDPSDLEQVGYNIKEGRADSA